MGILDRVRARDAAPPSILTAADTYYTGGNSIWSFDTTVAQVPRQAAMTVPAVARARNIICSTIGSLPLERYSTVTGGELPQIPLLVQPDFASPRAATWAWLADSIFFYGVGYMEVTGVYAEDGRPAGLRWLDPGRVQPILDNTSTMVVAYTVDGGRRPERGVGTVVAFPGLDEGILKRAARTIRTAIALEDAAYRAATEPLPQTVLQGTGAELPTEKVLDLLTKWKTARQTRATAYVSPGLEMRPVGFDPKAQQLVEARSFHASEIARATGIPAWYLNAETASMTYSNTEQERRTLVDFSLRPLISAIEDRLSMPDVTPRNVVVRFDLDDFLRGSMAERSTIAIGLLTGGIADRDEARDLVDLPPVPDAEVEVD